MVDMAIWILLLLAIVIWLGVAEMYRLRKTLSPHIEQLEAALREVESAEKTIAELERLIATVSQRPEVAAKLHGKTKPSIARRPTGERLLGQ